jgi:hypothetical protein
MSNNAFSTVLKRSNKKGWGLGRTFNHLRKMKKFEIWSDIVIFRLILFELKKMREVIPKSRTLHHFRTKISKDNYSKENKGEVLKDLTKLR